jgi:transglutaminase-like putative cysteine protease
MEHVAEGNPTVSPDYMQPTEYFDFDVEAVRNFAFESIRGATDNKEKAVKLFYAVRDQIRYDPYSITLDPVTYKASTVVAERSGFCLPKANLLIACARATGIPAGIGLADVRNHLCTDRLRRMMGGKDLFLHHGFAVLHIDGNWVKAAPAFNIELCEKFDVVPTEFDGEQPALFQEYDAKGRRHMEYVTDHGIWSDFPFDRMAKDFEDYYPSSVYDATARAAIDREIKTEKQAFEDERPLT